MAAHRLRRTSTPSWLSRPSVRAYTERDGLPQGTIHAIAFDAAGVPVGRDPGRRRPFQRPGLGRGSTCRTERRLELRPGRPPRARRKPLVRAGGRRPRQAPGGRGDGLRPARGASGGPGEPPARDRPTAGSGPRLTGEGSPGSRARASSRSSEGLPDLRVWQLLEGRNAAGAPSAPRRVRRGSRRAAATGDRWVAPRPRHVPRGGQRELAPRDGRGSGADALGRDVRRRSVPGAGADA